MHEKSKVFEPLPTGFRMRAHSPSRNSVPYKLLSLAGAPVTTTIDFVLPNLRLELVQAGRWWFSSRAMVTLLTQDQYLVLGSVMMASLVLILGNLVADFLLAIADPRIAYD